MATKPSNTSAQSGQVRHPLIGKVIRLNCEGGEYHSISRIVADLGNGLMLAKRLSPHTGRELDISHIIVLGRVGQDEDTAIFDSWAAYRRDHDNGCSHTTDSVVKLVPKTPSDE